MLFWAIKAEIARITVLEVCAIPWLHIRLGVVNHTLTKLEYEIPEAKEWPKSLHLHEERYHGTGYEGNEVQTLLSNVHRLENILREQDKLEAGKKFNRVFTAFQEFYHEYSKLKIDVSALEL